MRFPDSKPKEEMIQTFKKVRELREPQAHYVNEDTFYQKDLPDLFYTGEIWTF